MSGARGLWLTLLCLNLLAGPAASAGSEDDVLNEAVRISASIVRLEGERGGDDADLAAARAVLAVAADRRERIERHVSRAAEAEAEVDALERKVADARSTARRTLSGQTAPAAQPFDTLSTIGLRDARDGLDLTIARLRDQSSALDRRGPAILRTLHDIREQSGVNEAANRQNGTADTGAAAAAEVLEAARRYERESAVEALQRELGTIAPRARIVAARLRWLETRREGLAATWQRRVADDDAALLTSAQARVASLVDEVAADTPSAEGARPSLTLALGYARLIEDLAQRGSDLHQKEVALQRARRHLVHAEVGARATFAAGTLSDAQGVLLLRLRREMPVADELSASLIRASQDIERLRTRRVLWEDELRRLDADPSTERTGDTLRRLIDVARRHGDRLEQQALLLGDTLEGAATLGRLLDRRLLWLRRSEPLSRSLPRDVLTGVRWLSDPALWTEALSDSAATLSVRPHPTAAGLLLALGLVASRRRLLARQIRLAARVGHVGQDGYWVTPQAITLAALLALPVPLAIAALGWPLAGMEAGFARALGIALLAVASVLLTQRLFRRLARPGGVFITHFAWSETAAQDLEASLRRLGRVQVPMTFLLSLTLTGPQTRYGLGLLAFVLISLALGAFVWRVCRPRTGVLAIAGPDTRSTLASRLGAVVLVAVPVCVAVLPLAGYLDAAIALQARVLRSGLLLLCGAVVFGLLMRLYAISLRRYSLRWMRERRAERARSRDAAQAGEMLAGASAVDLLAPEPLAGQARIAFLALSISAVALGLWWLWAPLLPALGVVDEIVLWDRVRTVDGMTSATPVTLWNVLLALSLFTCGMLAARNLRGLLHVGLLQRIDLDPGTRYAIVTISGYVAFGIGLVGGLAQLGIDWSKLQWIVAALGVGLGFGLQEIVANFVSGLIILFERPVRVGDVVTIGNLSGTVSDIRIRATTVTDFENREVLLPNKAIITENVTNWTLRDATTRLLLSIGVAYGSDVEAVRTLLLDIVQSHPDVLSTPVPSVFFVGHGPSSLDFELRVFVASTAERLPTTHDLNASMNTRLKAAGIEIPFPRSDVTVRLPEGTARLGTGRGPDPRPDDADEARRAA